MPGMRRRRPLRRAATVAAVGGGAYAMGRSGGKSSAQEEQRTADVEAEAAEAKRLGEDAQATASAPPAGDSISKLKELAELRESGVLTEEEFAKEKAKVLGT